jgi:hypothetical protein
MKKINFKREYFVKNLFNPHMILDQFDLVHFENFNTFKKCLMNDLYHINKDKSIRVTIGSLAEYKALMEVFDKTSICQQTHASIKIEEQVVYENIMNNIIPNSYSIIITEDMEADIIKYWPVAKEWISKNQLVKIIKINAKNYDKKINKIINLYNQKHVRFFDLDIDYQSFDYMEIIELDKLKWWLHHLRNWITYDKIKNKIVILASNFYKPIFVSEDLILYLNDKKRHWIWQWFLGYHLEKNGEDIQYKELNKLRIYIDLHEEATSSEYGVFNWKMIDFEQCLKMTGSINEIPLMMVLIGRWLYDRP